MFDFSLDSLWYFYVVAKNGSFSAASLELFVSQSAISQSVRKLEDGLSCPLFIRSKKKLQLTPDGQLLYRALGDGFVHINSGVAAVMSRQNPQTGEIKIASTDTLCKHHLLPVIKKIHKKYPAIKVGITNGTSPHCKQLLEQGKVDIAVINLADSGEGEKFAVRKEYFFNDVFVANDSFKELGGEEVSLASLAGYPIITLDKNTVTRKFFDALFLRNGISLTPSVELQSVDLLIEMAKAGLGVSFVPSMCASKESELFIIKTKEEVPPRSFGALTLKNAVESPLTNFFIESF